MVKTLETFKIEDTSTQANAVQLSYIGWTVGFQYCWFRNRCMIFQEYHHPSTRDSISAFLMIFLFESRNTKLFCQLYGLSRMPTREASTSTYCGVWGETPSRKYKSPSKQTWDTVILVVPLCLSIRGGSDYFEHQLPGIPSYPTKQKEHVGADGGRDNGGYWYLGVWGVRHDGIPLFFFTCSGGFMRCTTL